MALLSQRGPSGVSSTGIYIQKAVSEKSPEKKESLSIKQMTSKDNKEGLFVSFILKRKENREQNGKATPFQSTCPKGFSVKKRSVLLSTPYLKGGISSSMPRYLAVTGIFQPKEPKAALSV
jgi:hypothetical protein